MIVALYAPPGEKAERWELDETTFTVGEILRIEKHFGGTVADFNRAVKQGSQTAMMLMLWIVRLRDEPTLARSALEDLLFHYLEIYREIPVDPGAPDESDAVADPKGTPPPSEPSESERPSPTE